MLREKSKERLLGIIFSYSNTILTMAITLLLVPLLLNTCGESDYSVYKVMSSFASPLSIVNFGISVYVSRGIAICNQNGELPDSKKRQKVLGLSVIVSGILFLCACAIASGFYLSIENLYQNTFTVSEMELAKKLFIIIALNIALHILDNGTLGCLIGNEKYTAMYGMTFAFNIFKAAMLAVLISVGCTVTAVALLDTLITFLLMIMHFGYVKFVLRERYCFTGLEKSEFKILLGFSVAMILQVIVNNINQSLDNIILGAMVSDKAIITMYSSALSLNTIFITFSNTIIAVYGTKIISAVEAGDDVQTLTKKAIEPTRYQAILTCLLCSGFLLFGKTFITVWIGEKYIKAYYVALSLIIPTSLTTVVGIYESFLDAKLKRTVRSLILVGMALFNAAVSIVLVGKIGYWGAAIGTAGSLIIGNLFVLNVYSSKVSGVSAIKLYAGAFSGIWKAILLSLMIGIPISLLLPVNWAGLISGIVIYTAVYSTLILLIGLKKEERQRFFKKVKNKTRPSEGI